MTYDIIVEGTPHRLELEHKDNVYGCKLDGKAMVVDAVLSRPNVLSLIIGGKAYEVKRELVGSELHVWVKNARYAVEVRDPRSFRSRKASSQGGAGPRKLMAPMPGKVVRLLVQEGEEVESGQGLIVVEAMKMQNELKAPRKGIVRRILAAPGAAVNPGDVLAIVD
jgi:biotin carboxyl carrier protein